MKSKVIAFLFIASTVSLFAKAQDENEEPEKKGFKKENLFTGGTVTASFYNGVTVLGISPLFGYKLANWIDAGLVFNLNYTSIRDYRQFDDKLKQTVKGVGVFTRLYPVNFLFVQGQLEKNFITQKYVPSPNLPIYNSYKETVNANSLLVGAGYTQGRQHGSNTFFYLAILFDVLKEENSPYVDVAIDPNTGYRSVRAIPIIRGGVNIGLFEGRNRNR
jgi:hypothetical protein